MPEPAGGRARWGGMITRRRVLRGIGAGALSGLATAAYGLGVEPWAAPAITTYRLTPPGWPPGLKLRIAALADIHAAEPVMPVGRVAAIAAATNALRPDIIVLLGDYMTAHPFVTTKVPPEAWASALATLKAPLGVHAVLGNHDWWDDRMVQANKRGIPKARLALEKVGIPVLENDSARLIKSGAVFWLVGLGDQLAFRLGHRRYRGVDDLAGALAKINNDGPVILLAHEPDIFARADPRIALTLSGHTHGGQVRLFGYSPIVPSKFGNRYAYGHVVENTRSLIVSGGLGCSIMPLRIGMRPEIVIAELGA